MFEALFAKAVFRDANEQSLIAKFFETKPEGIFVEVGANEPVVGSQSYFLERIGWTGVLVEPLHEYATQLRKFRRADVYEVAAGAPAQMGSLQPLLVAGALSTLRPQIKQGVVASSTRLVPVMTLDAILDRSGVPAIDFLSIDAEGGELDILRGFSIEKYQPKLVLIEDDAHTREKHEHLAARRYKLVRRTNLNNWYIPEGMPFPVSLFGHWQLIRKLYFSAPIRRWQLNRKRQSDRT